MSQKPIIESEPSRPERSESSGRRDDLAYIAPMAAFLLLTAASGKWPDYYAIFYPIKTVCAAVLLVALWKHYTKVRWDYWWLGVVVGVIGIFQWVGMKLWLERQFDFFDASPDAFNPYEAIASPGWLYAFLAVRILGAVVVVPVMEELFWRDFLWRSILAPNDFKLAKVGEWAWAPFLIVSIAFATVHGNWWLTSIVWALMIAGLLVYTKSLGACIIAHGVTNLLLAVYVLKYQDWAFW
jgi:CAAX prenyl protease-like protein